MELEQLYNLDPQSDLETALLSNHNHAEIFYFIVEMEDKESAHKIAEKLIMDMRDKDTEPKIVYGFVKRWNHYMLGEFEIDPLQIYMDHKSLLDIFRMERSYYGIPITYRILTDSLDISKDKLKEIILVIKDEYTNVSILDEYLRGCPRTRENNNRNNDKLMFDKTIVKIIVNITGINKVNCTDKGVVKYIKKFEIV